MFAPLDPDVNLQQPFPIDMSWDYWYCPMCECYPFEYPLDGFQHPTRLKTSYGDEDYHHIVGVVGGCEYCGAPTEDDKRFCSKQCIGKHAYSKRKAQEGGDS